MIRVGDLIVFVGLDVGPNRGGLGPPGPRRLGLDLARTATKRRADALSSVAVEVGLLRKVLTAVARY